MRAIDARLTPAPRSSAGTSDGRYSTFHDAARPIRAREWIQRVYIDKHALEDIPDCFPNKVQLQDSFQKGPGATLGFQGETQKGWGPEMWGITLQQIKEVLNHPLVHEDTLMRDVVRLAIKPATKQCGVGYALLLNQDKPLHANVMVSVSTCTSYMIIRNQFLHFNSTLIYPEWTRMCAAVSRQVVCLCCLWKMY